jgi:MarR family transcriptional regulator, organic hydroperoxide resistance regulator
MLLGVEPVEELRYLVLAAQRDGNRALAALLRPLGVTPAQAEVLGVLAATGRPLTVSELGEQLVCEPGSPSRLVASLVGAGLISRKAHERDGRASALALTDAGKRLAKQVRAAEERFHEDLRARLGARRDTDAALRALRRLAGDGASATALDRRRARMPR